MMISRKRSHSDIGSRWPQSQAVDEQVYRTLVLQLPSTVTEDELDDRVTNEAQSLGLLKAQVTPEIEDILSALSGTTVSFEPNSPETLPSQSPPPVPFSPNEHRPVTHSSVISEKSLPGSEAPSIQSTEVEKKRGSGFRRGFRKMTVFTKRKSIGLSSPTITSVNSDAANTIQSDQTSIRSGLKSPASIKSSKSSWSSPLSAAKSSYEQQPVSDHEAFKRSADCKEIQTLRSSQLEEKARFLDYQRSLFKSIRDQRDHDKSEKAKAHRRIVEEQQQKNDQAIEDFEARQLEYEMKMRKEHESEKRSVMTRLRHMEAYCQNPTPPPTPVDPASGRPSLDAPLPERKVTEKDYHNLAQQYRERDAMDSLHAAKINVLRGKQKKVVEKLVRKKDREIYELEQQQKFELHAIDQDYLAKEDLLRQALNMKRSRLEMRWRMLSMIERAKAERETGLKHAALTDIVAHEEPEVTLSVV